MCATTKIQANVLSHRSCLLHQELQSLSAEVPDLCSLSFRNLALTPNSSHCAPQFDRMQVILSSDTRALSTVFFLFVSSLLLTRTYNLNVCHISCNALIVFIVKSIFFKFLFFMHLMENLTSRNAALITPNHRICSCFSVFSPQAVASIFKSDSDG